MSGHTARALGIRTEASDRPGEARVLVDRVWPRGVSKERARLDEWLTAVAPSTELRKWYGHDPDRFAEFRKQYHAEVDGSDEATRAFEWLRELLESQPVALLTATRDLEHSQAAVLAQWLNRTS